MSAALLEVADVTHMDHCQQSSSSKVTELLLEQSATLQGTSQTPPAAHASHRALLIMSVLPHTFLAPVTSGLQLLLQLLRAA